MFALSKKQFFSVLLVILVSLPTLVCGFYNDDWIHRAARQGLLPHLNRDAFSLYQFVGAGEAKQLIESASLPWWTDPELKFQLFRPLGSVLVVLDHHWFGPLGSHVHSMLWFLLVVWLVRRIHLRLLPVRQANWATLIYALAGAHALVLAWTAGKHLLMGAAFGLAALLAQLNWRKQGFWRPLTVMALLAVGLCASEVTLGAVPYILAYEWLRTELRSRERLYRALPALAVSVMYLLWYAMAGMGTQGVGSYASPFSDPLGFLYAVASRAPLLVSELIFAFPAGLAHFNSSLAWILPLLGWIGLCFSAWLVRVWQRRDPTAGQLHWLWLGGLGSLVPVCGTIVDGRVLALPMLASSTLLGGSLVAGLFNQRNWGSQPRQRAFSGGMFVGLAAVHLVFAPALRLGTGEHFRQLAKAQSEIPVRASMDCTQHSQVIVVNGADPSISMYGRPLFALSTGVQRPWHVLTMAMNDLRLTVLDANQFELQVLGERRTNVMERIFRSEASPLLPGSTVRVLQLTATVLEQSQGLPTHVRFETQLPLSDPGYCFVRWVEGETGYLESFALPEHGDVVIAHSPGPMGF